MQTATQTFHLPEEIQAILDGCPGYTIANSVAELVEAACGDAEDNEWSEVVYDVPARGSSTSPRRSATRTSTASRSSSTTAANPGLHELFSYNLYPGPSAKKGIYGVLLNLGERRGWVTALLDRAGRHALRQRRHHHARRRQRRRQERDARARPPRADGRCCRAQSRHRRRAHLTLPRTCELRPVTDDMALCHPSLQKGRTASCGSSTPKTPGSSASTTSPLRHRSAPGALTDHPPEPLLFLNIDACPGSRALIWEHIEDAPASPARTRASSSRATSCRAS
jgi:hypothetical protein